MSDREQFTAWITKYALTKGVYSVRVELCANIAPDMVSTVTDSEVSWSQHFHGNDWHRTEREAAIRANRMRVDKIHSLHKQIAKLEKMTFAGLP